MSLREGVNKNFIPMESKEFDVVIIGSGPAGQKAAIQAAKLGKRVAVVEKDVIPGGACLHSGTIPSKTLRAAILDLTEFYEKSFYAKSHDKKAISINDLNYRLLKVVHTQEAIISNQFKKNKIDVVLGHAEFLDPYTVAISNTMGKITQRLKAKIFILATGSKPRNPNNVPFDDQVILDSTRLLAINKVPQTMLVLGGGIIGSEYASFFAALGTQVTVIDKREHMLPLLDREIGVHLQSALTDIGLKFVPKKNLKQIEKHAGKARVACEDGSEYEAEVLLYALGRVANVDKMGIENAGLILGPSGHIMVNDRFQTTVDNIYAVGDVIGPPALASTSMEQGRLAALYAFGYETKSFPKFYPIGIYTIPEISSSGQTERELKAKNIPYEVGRAYYYEIAASSIYGAQDVGMFKILFHKESREILGVHIIGRGATEVIHIGQVAMCYKAKIDFFIDQVFNYPTYAEGYRIAALNGYNKLSDKGGK